METKIVGVSLRRGGKIYYFDPAGVKLKIDDLVVVETRHGLKTGRAVIAPTKIIASELIKPLKPVLRKLEKQ